MGYPSIIEKLKKCRNIYIYNYVFENANSYKISIVI